MDRHNIKTGRLWYAVAVLILILGLLTAAIIIISTLRAYPSLIAEAYQGRLQHVEILGEGDLELSKKGAYAVYYEGHESAYIHAERPPSLDCSLRSRTTGEDIPLAPDHVPTNRYVTKDGDRVGVLIYSTTVKDPGIHTLSCDYPEGRPGPTLILAIGPNYVWEFFRVALKLSGSILDGLGVLCTSMVLSIGIASITLIRRSE